jgi:DNA-binding NarL/FixJ family response regulator
MVGGVAITRRVLILEDDSITRTLLGGVLESSGFETASAGSAAKAMRLLSTFDPDLAILDIDLGDGPTGLDFAVALSKLHPEVAIVFLTGLPNWQPPDSELASFPRRPGVLNKLELANTDALLAMIEASLRPSGEDPLAAKKTAPVALSRIQKTVLHLVAQGLSNAEIGQQRGTSLRATTKLLHTLQAEHPQLLLDSKYTRADSAREFLRDG